MVLYFEALKTGAPVAAPTMAQRQAERERAILVKPSQMMKRETYNGIDI